MALKPPPLGQVVQQISGLLGDSGLKGELDKHLKTLVQSALSRMDLVSRDEFDSQTEILARTRGRVEELENMLAELHSRIEKED